MQGSMGIPPRILNLCTRCMNGQLHATIALASGKGPPKPTEGEAEWAPKQVRK
jgi:hypothetical protein